MIWTVLSLEHCQQMVSHKMTSYLGSWIEVCLLLGCANHYQFCPRMSQTKQGKSEGFDSCDRPSNLAQI